MSEYKIGSLGSLISGKSDASVGTKIVYEKVIPEPRTARTAKLR